MADTMLIFGASRGDGNTTTLIKELENYIDFELVDLEDIKITPFDYEHKNRYDDFLTIIDRMLKYDKIIFASPIYWYTMSAQMKVFFDRFSDLLTIEKERGRKLRGKTAYVIGSGAEEIPKRSFEETFINSFNYLGMNYGGMLYVFFKKKNFQKILKRTL